MDNQIIKMKNLNHYMKIVAHFALYFFFLCVHIIFCKTLRKNIFRFLLTLIEKINPLFCFFGHVHHGKAQVITIKGYIKIVVHFFLFFISFFILYLVNTCVKIFLAIFEFYFKNAIPYVFFWTCILVKILRYNKDYMKIVAHFFLSFSLYVHTILSKTLRKHIFSFLLTFIQKFKHFPDSVAIYIIEKLTL